MMGSSGSTISGIRRRACVFSRPPYIRPSLISARRVIPVEPGALRLGVASGSRPSGNSFCYELLPVRLQLRITIALDWRLVMAVVLLVIVLLMK